MKKMSKTKKLILSALLLTLTIVLSRFLSIKTPLLSINFSFVPLILAAIWLGPKYTVLIAGLSDLIGAILFPFGEFFIGFTFSTCLAGLIYGLVLLFVALLSGVIRLEAIREVSQFLIEIMPLMFIPAAVGLLESWDALSGVFWQIMVATVVSTVLVMGVSGVITQWLIRRKEGRKS